MNAQPYIDVPDPKSAALDAAHNRRVVVGLLTLFGAAWICTLAPADSGIGFFAMVAPVWYLSMRHWRRRATAKIEAAFQPEPVLPSELEQWDSALRMATGKDARKLAKSMKQLEYDMVTQAALEQARRDAMLADLIRRGF